MPKATVSLVPIQFDLDSCPGGYVKIRRMPFGKKLQRLDMATEMGMRATKDMFDNKNPDAEAEMFMKSTQHTAAETDFRYCIVEHNLEDDNGQLIDFTKPGAIDQLDPKIGEEIATYIDRVNAYDPEVIKQGN